MRQRPDHTPAAAAESLGLYAISLERAPERWRAVRRGFADLPWPLIRVRALDAATESTEILAKRGISLLYAPQGLGWNPLRLRMFSLVEEAVFVSHLAALERFLASDHRFGVVLEDDAEPRGDVAAALRGVVHSGVEFEIVKLEGLRAEGSRRLVVVERDLGSSALVRSPTPSSGAAAYLVTRAAARKLLANSGDGLYRYDDYLSNPLLSGCDILHLAPYPIRQSRAESTMDALRRPVRDIRRRGLRFRLLQAARRGRLRWLPWWDLLSHPGRLSNRLARAPW